MSLTDAPWPVRRNAALIVGATLLVSGCGGDSGDSTDDRSASSVDTTVSDQTTVSPDTTSPDPTTTTTTAAPPSTTTTEPRPSLFVAQKLSDPARLLVDAIPAPGTGSESSVPPPLQLHASPSSFVVWPGELDEQNPTKVALPLTVRGYSRWFESAGIVEVQHADGTAATATVSGPQVFNPGAGSSWGLTATGWLEAWGTFEFTIDDLEPGEYRLRVGEYPPIDDSDFVGVTIPLEVPEP